MSSHRSPPPLYIPESSSTVSVAVIETTSRIVADTSFVVTPHIKGHDQFDCPCLSFLATNKATNKKILFDLGIRKDPENLSPTTQGFASKMSISSEQNVADILGAEASEISAIIWSHHHFDHIGDASTFPSSTALVVGAGFRKEFLPGYPMNKDSWILESDYAGRELREIDFKSAGLRIGQFDAFDYFGDGSFYLLDCPGHSIGHTMALARTTPTTFVLMGADCCHHGGELRPSEYVPLPENISPNPLPSNAMFPRHLPCPGSLFANVHPHRSRSEPFYQLQNPNNTEAVFEAMRSQRKLAEFDASDDILVINAHDPDAPSVIDLYPNTVDNWHENGYKKKLHWAFLKDFEVE